jgi:PIN domain nuclease of toxin-antitoxin system
VLLDTHVWLWAADDHARLGRRTRRLLDKAAAAGTLHLSAVSMFEVTALHLAGRLLLATPLETWIRTSIDRGRLRVVDLTPGIAVDAGLIPVTSVPDPIDRMLIASARDLDVPLVTRDRKLLAYARATGFVRLADAAR